MPGVSKFSSAQHRERRFLSSRYLADRAHLASSYDFSVPDLEKGLEALGMSLTSASR